MLFGDDRGVNIRIIRSEFTNSRFCKGLIVYESAPKLDSTSTTIISLAKEYWTRYPFEFTTMPEISIQDSSFTNLNMFKTINKLSYGERNGTIYGLDSVSYPYLDNHGAVLNIQGFPGGISFYNNTV